MTIRITNRMQNPCMLKPIISLLRTEWTGETQLSVAALALLQLQEAPQTEYHWLDLHISGAKSQFRIVSIIRISSVAFVTKNIDFISCTNVLQTNPAC